MLLQEGVLSKGSSIAVTCSQPIFHFRCEYRTCRTWPRTRSPFIFDSIMQIDFERMGTYAIRECNTNTEKNSFPESLLAEELASHFSSLQKISYLFLALFPQTIGIQLRDLHNGFLPSCRLCPIRAGKRGKFNLDSDTRVGRCPCCMSHFQTKGERGGKYLLMPLEEGKRNKSGHFLAQSSASHCFHWGPLEEQKMICSAAKNGAFKFTKTSNSYPMTTRSHTALLLLLRWMLQRYS